MSQFEADLAVLSRVWYREICNSVEITEDKYELEKSMFWMFEKYDLKRSDSENKVKYLSFIIKYLKSRVRKSGKDFNMLRAVNSASLESDRRLLSSYLIAKKSFEQIASQSPESCSTVRRRIRKLLVFSDDKK